LLTALKPITFTSVFFVFFTGVGTFQSKLPALGDVPAAFNHVTPPSRNISL